MGRYKDLTYEAKLKAFKELAKEIASEGADEKDVVKIVPLSESSHEALERLKNPDQLDGYSTGYEKLDKLIGGFANGEIIVIGAATGIGKTQFAQSLIMNLAFNSVPVLFFTLEMSRVETTIRFMRMIKSKCDGDVLTQLPIYYQDCENVNLKILEESIRQGIEKGVKIVFIDHLHFFSRSVENQSAEIGIITQQFKLLARKYNVPIVYISHLRKMNNPNKKPELDDFRDSSFIAQDADIALMLWRKPDDRNETCRRTTRCYIRKSRRRDMGITAYYLDRNYYLQEVEYDPQDDDF